MKHPLDPVYLLGKQAPIVFDDLQTLDLLRVPYRQMRRADDLGQIFHVRYGLTEVPAGRTYYSADGNLNRLGTADSAAILLWKNNRLSEAVPSGELATFREDRYGDRAFHLDGVSRLIRDCASEAVSTGDQFVQDELNGRNSGLPGSTHVNKRDWFRTASPKLLGGLIREIRQSIYPYRPYSANGNGQRPDLKYAPDIEFSSDDPTVCARPISQPGVLRMDIPDLLPAHDRSLWRDKFSNTSERALTNQFDSITYLKESPEIVETFLTLIKLGSVLKNPRALSNFRKFRRLVSDQYLNLVFGILPTIADISDINEMSERLLSGKILIPVASEMDLQGSRSAVGDGDLLSLPANSLSDPLETGEPESKQYFVSTATFSLPGYDSKRWKFALCQSLVPRSISRIKAFVPASVIAPFKGANALMRSYTEVKSIDSLSAWADSLWEVLPFSWLVDYFVNAEQLVALAARQGPDWDALRTKGFYSLYTFDGLEHLSSLYRCKSPEYPNGEPKEGWLFDKLIFTSVRSRIGVRQFSRFAGFDFLKPKLDPSIELSRRQLANIAALLSK